MSVIAACISIARQWWPACAPIWPPPAYVAREVGKGSLILSSDQGHLENGHFDADRMLQGLETAVHQALSEGCQGLWATGDMTWEFGSKGDFGKLLDYEWKLEDLFRRQPCLSCVCQYHMDTLPQDAVRDGLRSHQTIFITRLCPA